MIFSCLDSFMAFRSLRRCSVISAQISGLCRWPFLCSTALLRLISLLKVVFLLLDSSDSFTYCPIAVPSSSSSSSYPPQVASSFISGANTSIARYYALPTLFNSLFLSLWYFFIAYLVRVAGSLLAISSCCTSTKVNVPPVKTSSPAPRN